MKCRACKGRFKDGDEVVPVMRYVTNERRGDFVSGNPNAFIHARHLYPPKTLCLAQVAEDDWCTRPEGHKGLHDPNASTRLSRG